MNEMSVGEPSRRFLQLGWVEQSAKLKNQIVHQAEFPRLLIIARKDASQNRIHCASVPGEIQENMVSKVTVNLYRVVVHYKI